MCALQTEKCPKIKTVLVKVTEFCLVFVLLELGWNLWRIQVKKEMQQPCFLVHMKEATVFIVFKPILLPTYLEFSLYSSRLLLLDACRFWMPLHFKMIFT